MIDLTRPFRGLAVLLLIAAALAWSPLAAGAEPDAAVPPPFHVKGTVVTPDGKPAAGVTVLYDRLKWNADAKVDETQTMQTVTTDADGAFDIADSPTDPKSPYPVQYVLYLTSTAGVAVSGPQRKSPIIILQPFTQVRVHLVGEDGKPLAGLKILPLYLYHDRDFAPWFSKLSDAWTGVTDADGNVTFSQMPQGYTSVLDVEDERYTEPDQRDPLVLAKTADTSDKTIKLFRAGTIAGTVHYDSPTGAPAAGVQVAANSPQGGGGGAQTDKDGHFLIKRLRPGPYTLQPFVMGAEGVQWTALAKSAALTSAGSMSGVTLSLIHGALLTGTVTDKANGKPIAKMSVIATGPSDTRIYAQTSAEGQYQLRVPPGSQRVMAFGQGTDQTQSQIVQIADGQTKTMNFRVTAPPVPQVVKGVVVGPDGKPVPGAKVLAFDDTQGDPNVVADAQGRFVFDDPGLSPKARLFARSGNLTTPTAVMPASNVTLHLVPGILCTVQGLVRDDHGQPLSNVKVTLTLWQNDTGRETDSVQTDAAGRYAFAPALGFSGVKYGVRAERTGYSPAEAPETAALPGQTLTLKPMALVRADSFVGGIVRDPQGKPEAGAQVTVIHGGYAYGTTNADGRFHITGVPPGEANIEAKAPDGRSANSLAAVGTDDNYVKVLTQDEMEAQSRRIRAMMQNNHSDGAKASALLASAEKRAGASGKKVFLVFQSSWCGGCILLKNILHDPHVKPFFDAQFVVQDIDIWEKGDKHTTWENSGGTALYKKYGGIKPNGGRQGVPFIVVLDPAGRKIGDSTRSGQNTGVPTAPDDLRVFNQMLKRAAPRLTDADFAAFGSAIRFYEF